MIDSGEVAADIGLEYVAHLPSHDLPPKGLQGVVRVATRSKTETAVEEVGFEHRISPERRAIQDDDGANPGMFSVLEKQALWARKD